MRRLLAWMLVSIVVGWAALIPVAPHVLGAADAGLAVRVGESPLGTYPALLAYLAGRVVCHQRPERSFQAAGHPFPVCARCTGLYLGASFGLAAALFVWPRRGVAGSAVRSFGASEAAAGGRTYTWWRWALTLAAVPTVLSVGIEQLFGLSCNASRALTAAPLGATVAALMGGVLSDRLLHYGERRGPGGRGD